jgi:hypothetical protein
MLNISSTLTVTFFRLLCCDCCKSRCFVRIAFGLSPLGVFAYYSSTLTCFPDSYILDFTGSYKFLTLTNLIHRLLWTSIWTLFFSKSIVFDSYAYFRLLRTYVYSTTLMCFFDSYAHLFILFIIFQFIMSGRGKGGKGGTGGGGKKQPPKKARSKTPPPLLPNKGKG